MTTHTFASRRRGAAAAALLLALCLLPPAGGQPVSVSETAARHLSYSGSAAFNYYDQLSAFQKTLYNKLKALDPSHVADHYDGSTLMNLMTGIKDGDNGFHSSNAIKDIYAAFDAVMKDCPELFWARGANAGYSGLGDKFDLLYAPVPHDASYRTDTAGKVRTLNSAVASIVSHAKSGATDYDRLKRAHDRLAVDLTYVSGNTSHDAYGALSTGKAVCEGYAKAFKLVCDGLGIPCVLVVGTGYTSSGSENHMWNYVYMKDKSAWYAVDVTWDDQESGVLYDFFLVGADTVSANFKLSGKSATFSAMHKESGKFSSDAQSKTFQYPALSKAAYSASAPASGTTAAPPASTSPRSSAGGGTPSTPANTAGGGNTVAGSVSGATDAEADASSSGTTGGEETADGTDDTTDAAGSTAPKSTSSSAATTTDPHEETDGGNGTVVIVVVVAAGIIVAGGGSTAAALILLKRR